MTVHLYHWEPNANSGKPMLALAEKGVPFERVTIDLADKPDWFKAISPLGKVPLLRVAQPGRARMAHRGGAARRGGRSQPRGW